MNIFDLAGTWFGYVGSCVASPLPACRPFLAFLALAIASAVSLALLVGIMREIGKRAMQEHGGVSTRALSGIALGAQHASMHMHARGGPARHPTA